MNIAAPDAPVQNAIIARYRYRPAAYQSVDLQFPLVVYKRAELPHRKRRYYSEKDYKGLGVVKDCSYHYGHEEYA